MGQILVVESSPLRQDSSSNKLSKVIVDKLMLKNPHMSLKVRDLITNPPPLLTSLEFGPYSDEAINELFSSDVIILNIATHNFSIPGVLKAWIDQVIRAGKTFSYSAAGPEALLKGKKVYLSIAAGGIAPKEPGQEFIESYLRAVLGFVGLTDITTFRVEGLAIPGIKETAMDVAVDLVHHSKEILTERK